MSTSLAPLLLCVLVATLLGCREKSDSPIRPDIVLISIDSLRPDHLGCYGYSKPTSPRIDRIAASGVRFENAVSSTSWTLPAHAGLFTGLYDQTHGVSNETRRLAESHVTLAEILRDAGYQTAGFYGAPYLHPSFGLDQGFEVYEGYIESLWEELPESEFRSELAGGRLGTTEEISGPRMHAAVRAWLERADQRPLFLFLHAWDVHFDYIPPDRYVEMFDPDYEGDLDVRQLMRNPAIHAQMKPRDLEHLLARYDGEIRFTDDTLAEIFDELEGRGRLANTIVVVTADHGEEFFEHGGKAHRRTLFDEVVRVPLIVAWPGVLRTGLVIEDQVRLIDVLPTLVSLAGLPLPIEVQGRDLSPLMRGEASTAPDALMQLEGSLQALRSNARKLVVRRNQSSHLYDLTSDAGELHPLPAGSPEYRASRAQLARAVARALDFREGLGRRSAEASELDPAIRERLEALGYLEGGEEPSPEP